MQSSRGLSRLHRPLGWHSFLCVSQRRNASLTAAIEKGIRKGKRGVEIVENKWYTRSYEDSSTQESRPERTKDRARTGGDRTGFGRSESSTEQRDNRCDVGLRGEKKPWQLERRSREGLGTARRDPGRLIEGDAGRHTQETEGRRKERRASTSKDHSNSSEGVTRYSPNHAPGSYASLPQYFSGKRKPQDGELPSRFLRGKSGGIELRSSNRDGEDGGGNESRSHGKIAANAPMAIPYTTAGSEFVYGTFGVKAALQSRRRKLYKLYISKGENSERDGHQDSSIKKLALAAGVRVMEVGGEWNRLLSKMSATRPHNGYVLEASPIPKLPITALQTIEKSDRYFTVDLAHQSEEEMAVNACLQTSGTKATIDRHDITHFPLVLMLDRILDPGNLGAIIRSADFLGADAVIVVDHGTSPFSPVTVKASAGAAESFPILTVRKEHQFIKVSQANGWKFFAATSPDSASSIVKSDSQHTDLRVASVLKEYPCVLMLGNESEGLRPQLQKRADSFVSIANARGSQQGLESLNVSIAAALLLQDFFRDLKQVQKEEVSSNSQKTKDDEALF